MGRSVAVDTRWNLQIGRRGDVNARMIVVEDESVAVSVVLLAADPQIPRTEVAVGHIFRNFRLFPAHCLAAPRPVLPVRRYDHTLFPQRMSALLPKHFFSPVS